MSINNEWKGRRYPWADWFNKGFVRLTRRKQFPGEPAFFAQQVRVAARRLKYRVEVSVEGDTVIVNATKET